jgi:hypothetical protein
MFGQLVCFLSMALDSDNFVQVFKNDWYINIGKSIVFFCYSVTSWINATVLVKNKIKKQDRL